MLFTSTHPNVVPGLAFHLHSLPMLLSLEINETLTLGQLCDQLTVTGLCLIQNAPGQLTWVFECSLFKSLGNH